MRTRGDSSEKLSTWSSLPSESAECQIISCDDLVVLDESPMGAGSFGTVYRGLCYHMTVAIKVLAATVDEPDEEAMKEVKIMCELRHKNVLFFLGVCIDPPCIVTEYCGNGSLFDLLKKERAHKVRKGTSQTAMKNWHKRLAMLRDVAQGMYFLHNRNNPVLHMDLKSPNVLVRKNCEAAVGDFGLSSFVKNPIGRIENMNPVWLAPEIVDNSKEACTKSDVYPFGIIMWEVMTGFVPWDGWNHDQVVQEVLFKKSRPPVATSYTSSTWQKMYVQLMEECWAELCENRPTYSEILVKLEEIEKEMTGKQIKERGIPIKELMKGGPSCSFDPDWAKTSSKRPAKHNCFNMLLSVATCGLLSRGPQDCQDTQAAQPFIQINSAKAPLDTPFGNIAAFGDSFSDADSRHSDQQVTSPEVDDSDDDDLFYSCISFDLDGSLGDSRNAKEQPQAKHFFVEPEEDEDGAVERYLEGCGVRSGPADVPISKRPTLQVVDKSVPNHETWQNIRKYIIEEIDGDTGKQDRWKKIVALGKKNLDVPSDEVWRQFLRNFFGPIETSEDIVEFRSSKHWRNLKAHMVKRKVPIPAPPLQAYNSSSSELPSLIRHSQELSGAFRVGPRSLSLRSIQTPGLYPVVEHQEVFATHQAVHTEHEDPPGQSAFANYQPFQGFNPGNTWQHPVTGANAQGSYPPPGLGQCGDHPHGEGGCDEII